jgi:hypothetical protein
MRLESRLWTCILAVGNGVENGVENCVDFFMWRIKTIKIHAYFRRDFRHEREQFAAPFCDSIGALL